MTKDELVKYLTRRQESAEEKLASWRDDFTENAEYAFRWADAATAAASEQMYVTRLLHWLANPTVMPEDVLDEVRKQVLRDASRGVLNSTSPMDNVMTNVQLKVDADLLSFLEENVR